MQTSQHITKLLFHNDCFPYNARASKWASVQDTRIINCEWHAQEIKLTLCFIACRLNNAHSLLCVIIISLPPRAMPRLGSPLCNACPRFVTGIWLLMFDTGKTADFAGFLLQWHWIKKGSSLMNILRTFEGSSQFKVYEELIISYWVYILPVNANT